jgi:Rrf2 family nitric oxide-sensitive transcriptional repressor
MRLTVYTDYALRVMMYLALHHGDGEKVTIERMARAYGISRSHLMKIVNEFSQHGLIEATRGRTGGLRLGREPAAITIGEIVRLAEEDFALVECHGSGEASDCVIVRSCQLKQGLRRAVEAFFAELDAMTLADTVASPEMAADMLGTEGALGAVIPILSAP